MPTYRHNEINWIKSAFTEFFQPITVLVTVIQRIASMPNKSDEMEATLRLLHEQIKKVAYDHDQISERMSLYYEKQDSAIKENLKYITNLDNDIKSIDFTLKKTLGYYNEDKSNLSHSYIDEMTFKISELKTKELIDGNKLTMPAAEMGLANIQYLLSILQQKERTKPYLVGVNRGGTSLAALLAKRLDLEGKYVLRCDYNKKYDRVFDVDENRTDIDGPVVIVDDITRTGTTLRKVQKYIKEKYKDKKIFTFILIASCNKQSNFKEVKEIIDYTPWVTQYKDVHLPWNDVKEGEQIIPSDFFDDLEINQFLGRLSYDMDEPSFCKKLNEEK